MIAVNFRRFLRHPVRAVAQRGRRFATWVDAFWGYDVFIAHRRADAATYALALHNVLMKQNDGISVFVDTVVYDPGTSLSVATKRHAAKSTLLCLVASPELLKPRVPVDWVAEELSAYLTSNLTDPRVLIIDFGSIVDRALSNAVEGDGRAPDRILPKLREFLRLSEPADGLSVAPTQQVIDSIRRNLGGRRRDRSRLRVAQTAVGVLSALFVVAVIAAWIAYHEFTLSLQSETRVERQSG
jgi:hypothetical protein